MSRFHICVIAREDKARGVELSELYDGDDPVEAWAAVEKGRRDPSNAGKVIRRYDFALFGGSICDYPAHLTNTGNK